MATLSVLKFGTPDGADRALAVLQQLQQQHLIHVMDAAVVTWPRDRKRPKTMQAVSTLMAGALGGSFWGLLFGLIFFVPILGLALGAATGALAGALTDYGIDDNFIRQMQQKVTPGTSALFLMAETTAADRVVTARKDVNPELVTTNLPGEKEARPREMFAAA